MIYALITARKNSKGIKNKNLIKIAGKSLLQISIDNSKKIKIFKKIFCSTDSTKMIKIAKKNNIEYIERPNSLSKDNSLSTDVIFHFIDYLKKNKIDIPEIIFLFQPTSPFIKTQTIKNILNKYKSNKRLSSIISISKISNKFHFINQRKITKKNDIKFIFNKLREKHVRRQEKPEVFAHGNIFSFKTKKFIQQKSVTPTPIGYEILKTSWESIDIDDINDYQNALLYNKKFFKKI